MRTMNFQRFPLMWWTSYTADKDDKKVTINNLNGGNMSSDLLCIKGQTVKLYISIVTLKPGRFYFC